MTEQKTETASYGALVWQKARLVLRMASSVTDWPNAFTPTELAKLQYPESAGTEKRITRDNRTALEAALKADIQAGRIGITLKSQAPITGISGVYLARWGGRSSLQAEMEACEVTAIERSPFRAWLSANKQEPSEHIHAWLGDQVQPAQSPESANSQAEAPTPYKDGRVTETRERQIQAIEKAARDLEYLDPLKIPTGGKAAIKAHCIAWPAFGHSESAFRAAWRVANKEGRIRLTEKEKYM